MTNGEFMWMEQRIKDHIDRRTSNNCKWSKTQWAIRIAIVCGLTFYVVNEIYKLVG